MFRFPLIPSFLLRPLMTGLCAGLSLGVLHAAPPPSAPGRTVEFSPGVAWFDLRLAEGAEVTRIQVSPETDALKTGPRFILLELVPDKAEEQIRVMERRWDEEAQKWVSGSATALVFWPKKDDKKALTALEEDGIAPRRWDQEKIPGVIRIGTDRIQLWLAGKLVLTSDLDPAKKYRVEIEPGKNTAVENVAQEAREADDRFEPMELSHLAKSGKEKQPRETRVDGIPFELWEEGRSQVSLAEAGWPDWKRDPSHFTELYDAGGYFLGDRRMPFVQVPRADYTAAYLLAYADPDPGKTNRVTLRAGRRLKGSGSQAQVVIKDFGGEVPRGSGKEAPGAPPEQALRVVRIPIGEAFAQNILGEVMDIELTKEIRLARRSPDPNRYRWRPLGLPSGVRIAAITLEKSPIQMELRPTVGGGLFELPEVPGFKARLSNPTREPRKFSLTLASGNGPERTVNGEVPAGKSVEKTVELPGLPLGYHKLTATLKAASGETLLTQATSFGIVPADTRRYRDESPLGTSVGGGTHFTSPDFDLYGQLLKKLGLRYASSKGPLESRARYGLVEGYEYSLRAKRWTDANAVLEGYAERMREFPDTPPNLMLFHEDGISGNHATRLPDIFHDRPPYVLKPEERERLKKMMKMASETAKLFREKHPEMTISFGQGGLTFREEFYRNGFDSEYFDSAGNENPTFGRLPETQPPDNVGNNSSLWMDRQMLDAYGYKDKVVTQCHETIYPATNPGNLSYRAHSSYLVRHLLHSMVWRMPRIRGASLMDKGNSYYHSHWGGNGMFTCHPEVAPKPAAIAVATLTRVLDGARYEDYIETGSDSAYLLRFKKKDGSLVLVAWVVRGERDYRLKLDSARAAMLVEPLGPSRELPVENGEVVMKVDSAPRYLELPAGASVKTVSLGKPAYEAPGTERLAELDPLDSLAAWSVAQKRNPELEFYNPVSPRRKGNFAVEPVRNVEGEPSALRVTPGPLEGGKPTMPMYAELVHARGIPLPGRPSELGLWVNGNSGWGRIIFELTDASGQRWVSIGAKAKANSEWLADWVGKELAAEFRPGEISDWNTDDVWGLSRINFDGWHYVGYPLPGQYPGEGFHWASNSQWRWDGDGTVHYPLTVKKVIVEMPEKTLYLDRYAPAKRPEIYLRRLVSQEREMNAPKTVAGDYVEAVQMEVR